MNSRLAPPSDDPRVNKMREYNRKHRAKFREKYRELNREWIAENSDKYRFAKAKYRLRVKARAMLLYSDPIRCSQCGFDKIDGLVLDHINDNGKSHRVAERIGHRGGVGSGTRIYEVIQRKGKIEGLQVLCANCNTIKQIQKCRRDSIKNPEFLAEIEAKYAGNPTALRMEATRLSGRRLAVSEHGRFKGRSLLAEKKRKR